MKGLQWVALAVEAGAGILLLTRPNLAIEVAGAPNDRVTRRVLQVLGARQLVQALVIARRPAPGVVGIGAAVDALHSASMVLACVVLPAHRKLAALSAGQAGVCALLLGRPRSSARQG